MRISHSQRLLAVVRLKDSLDAYFDEHPDDLGWHWHQRKFSSIAKAQQWYTWLVKHGEDHGLAAPVWAISVRGATAYVTKRTAKGEAWSSDGRPVLQPLSYRRSLEQQGETP